MNKLMKAVLTAAVISLTATSVMAKDTLIFATTHPKKMPLDVEFLAPWVEAINAEGKDILEIDIRYGPAIANPLNFYDRTIDDVIQIGFGLTVFGANRWPRSLVSTMPFLVDTAEQGSVAMWDIYEQGAFDKEMDDIVVLMFGEFPQSGIHTNGSKITSIKDVEGLKMITSSPANVGLMKRFGAAPLSFVITEQYEALQRGTANGSVVNFTAFPAFKLDEVTTDHLLIPMGGVAAMVFMAKERFDALSPEAQELLMKHSGRKATRAFGKFLDIWENRTANMIGKLPNHTVTVATDEEISELAEFSSKSIHSGWAANTPDGEKVLEMFKAALDKVAAE